MHLDLLRPPERICKLKRAIGIVIDIAIVQPLDTAHHQVRRSFSYCYLVILDLVSRDVPQLGVERYRAGLELRPHGFRHLCDKKSIREDGACQGEGGGVRVLIIGRRVFTISRYQSKCGMLRHRVTIILELYYCCFANVVAYRIN